MKYLNESISDAHEAIADILPIESSKWTDEQWAEHDKRVREEIAQRESPDRVAQPAVVLQRLGWPSKAVDAAKDADVKRPAVQQLATVDFAKTNVVVLSGATGCGKTVAAARWALMRTHGATFLRAATFAASSRYSADDRRVWFSASALVLDDLGSEYLDTKGSFLVDLDELVDTYYGDLRPLAITTNLTLDDFGKRYGDRIRDRLRECARWLSVSAPSLRGLK